MTNVFFPEDKVTTDDLYFVCYMIERIARQLKQPNKYVVNMMGHDELAKKLSLADTLHSENPLAVEADWIGDYQLQPGDYDVTKVDAELCPNIPTATQMGKVYKRLVLNTIQPSEDYADAILRGSYSEEEKKMVRTMLSCGGSFTVCVTGIPCSWARCT